MTDQIERGAAIQNLIDLINPKGAVAGQMAIHAAVRELKNLPTATPWTPASELPDSNRPVMCLYEYGNERGSSRGEYHKDGWLCDREQLYDVMDHNTSNPPEFIYIAWHELPALPENKSDTGGVG